MALALILSTVATATAAAAEESLPGVLYSVAPAFPAAVRGVVHADGHAVIALTVDENGIVLDQLALEASHLEFAASAERAVRQWMFAPMASDTQPRRVVLQFEFRRNGVVTTLSHAEAVQQSFDVAREQGAVRIVMASALTDAPRRTVGSMPRLPRAVLERGPLVASFIIDVQGRVRLPVVDRSVPAEIAREILRAVAAWRYEPQHLGGQPVLVQAASRFELPAAVAAPQGGV